MYYSVPSSNLGFSLKPPTWLTSAVSKVAQVSTKADIEFAKVAAALSPSPASPAGQSPDASPNRLILGEEPGTNWLVPALVIGAAFLFMRKK